MIDVSRPNPFQSVSTDLDAPRGEFPPAEPPGTEFIRARRLRDEENERRYKGLELNNRVVGIVTLVLWPVFALVVLRWEPIAGAWIGGFRVIGFRV
jgi:hypothetical protein